MASSVLRLVSHSRRARRSPFVPLPGPFSSQSLVEYKHGEIGAQSGISDKHLVIKVAIPSPAQTASQQGSGNVGRGNINFIATQQYAPVSLAKLVSHSFCTSTKPTETQTQKLERIADELLSLNKLERYDYSILLRHKMGLNKYGPAVSGVQSASAPAGAGPQEEKSSKKTVFDVKLEKFDAAAKIKIIKEVRSFTDLGLKDAKDLVEKVPVVVKKGLTKDEAESISEKLKALGAIVVLE